MFRKLSQIFVLKNLRTIFLNDTIMPHWLRTLRQNFARLVSLIAFQHVQHMLGSLWPNLDTSGIRGPETKTENTENLRSIFSDFLVVPFS